MKIDNFEIAQGKVFIIAEVSANHNGDYEIAKKMIKAAKDAGADAVKLQTYRADTMTLDVKNEYFMIDQGTLWDGKSLYDLYSEAYTPWEWQPKLKKYADELGIILFSSPFDKTSVDFLEEMSVGAYKIASFEITDLPLIRYVAKKQKPIIISTGIASLQDIQEAIDVCKEEGNEDIILLKCTSAYPAPLEDANLLTIEDLSKRFGVVAGFSDHTLGITAPITAVALGAQVIEKHFILDKSMGGVDSAFSLDIKEFAEMVQAVRDTQKLMGSVSYEMDAKKLKSREFSRSIFISKDIKKGEKFSEHNIKIVRPAYGLAPKYIDKVLGKIADKDYTMGSPLKTLPKDSK